MKDANPNIQNRNFVRERRNEFMFRGRRQSDQLDFDVRRKDRRNEVRMDNPGRRFEDLINWI